jgi:hypothetical protein
MVHAAAPLSRHKARRNKSPVPAEKSLLVWNYNRLQYISGVLNDSKYLAMQDTVLSN